MQNQMQVPRLTKINKILIILMGLGFLTTAICQRFGIWNPEQFFGLSYWGLKKFYFFQLATFPFFDSGLMSVLFDALVIWFIGGDLEERWGSKTYLKFLAIITLLSASIVCLIVSIFHFQDFFLKGMTGPTLGLLVGYAIHFPDRQLLFMFLFPLKAKYFCLLIAFIQFYMAVFSPGGGSSWAFLIFLSISYLLIKPPSWPKFKRKKKKKNHLKLVKSENEQKYWH